MFGRKSLELDEQCCLHYIHNGTWVIVCISKKPDVTLYEAFNFLEKLKEAIDSNLDLQGLDQQIEPEQATRYKKYGKEVSSFISQWNDNPNNRDKTYLVFQDLLKVKDEMLQNLNLLNDRDLLLDQANQKAKNLDSRAKLLLKNTKKIKTKFKRRRCILWTSQSKFSKLLCCFRRDDSNLANILNIKTLTCDKLSHCLFDFDCVDLNVYERETYNYQEFTLNALGQQEDQNQLKTTDDIAIMVEGTKITMDNYTESNNYLSNPVLDNLVMRVLYKPESQTLWGLHQPHIQDFLREQKEDDLDDVFDEMDEENEVEMNKTMWLVLRKTKPQNSTLRNFFTEPTFQYIKLKDIIKFGRVNFKISALHSKQLRPDIQGLGPTKTDNDAMSSHSANVDKIQISQVSMMNITEMNMMDNIGNSYNNYNQSTFLPGISKAVNDDNNQGNGPPIKTKDKNPTQSQARVCRICLGEDEDEYGEFLCPCNCSGSMKDIHISCLKEWLNGKKLVYHGDRVKSFFWKALECELCKQPFENKLKDRLFQIMDFEKPETDYMIMESVKSAPAKVIHVFYLNQSDEFRVGRSVDTDMKIADISVSRLHSYIRILGDQLVIEDNGSKFGTLIKIKEPYELAISGQPRKQSSLYQIGRTLIYFGLHQKGRSQKKNQKRMNRKIDSSIMNENSEYIRTISGRRIPVEFQRPNKLQNKKYNSNMKLQLPNEQQLISKMQTGRVNEKQYEDAESEESKHAINHIQETIYRLPVSPKQNNLQESNHQSNDAVSSNDHQGQNLHQSIVRRQINPRIFNDLNQPDQHQLDHEEEENLRINENRNTRVHTNNLNHQKYKSIVPGINFNTQNMHLNRKNVANHQRYRSMQDQKHDMTSNIHDELEMDDDQDIEEGKDDTPEQYDLEVIQFKDSISNKRMRAGDILSNTKMHKDMTANIHVSSQNFFERDEKSILSFVRRDSTQEQLIDINSVMKENSRGFRSGNIRDLLDNGTEQENAQRAHQHALNRVVTDDAFDIQNLTSLHNLNHEELTVTEQVKQFQTNQQQFQDMNRLSQ
ncbi:fha domain [Stylonychia lemnae]|uniref:Fha domain n=1 Tax=Stylonychia lemnae TaxID=5949 RepID=A0A078AVY5_STYLE|nr:fha domain [Stylonychia lemnae]|eukprot:CDW85377.1 fha domain [Stylonychia lemnae]